MYKEIKNYLNSLLNKEVIVTIDEGRSRKKRQKAIISAVYNRIFTILINDVLLSFSYSDLICKTITINTM